VLVHSLVTSFDQVIRTSQRELEGIELIKEYPRAGYDALKDVEFPWPVAEVAYQHHERMDGSGYPRGLKGGEILLEARIMSVADVVEAMASTRRLRRSSAAAVLSTIRL
jgi:HD-GYP domain-containing protein (c-di-GMP phosphodiesterase class II)